MKDAAFPAYELLRAEPRKMPRNWPAIWQQKGGTLYQGRMIAPKTDPIWTRISRFGLPYPPFDYNSGMDIFSVSRSECLALGVPLPEPGSANGASAPSFNDNLQAELPIADNSPEANRLREAFGDQIRFDGNVAHWRGELIQEVLSGKVRSAKLGRGYDGRNLSISHNIFKDHLHIHVGAEEHDRRNIPLTKGDFELLPAMWRKPSKVNKERSRDHLEFETFDGGVLNLIVDPVKGIVSFYKMKIPGGA